MIQIFLAVVALFVVAFVVGLGVNFVNPAAVSAVSTVVSVQSGFRTLQSAALSYRTTNGSYPSATASGEAPSLLIPDYANQPRTPQGTSWTYGSDTPGSALWVCLSGTSVDWEVWHAMARILTLSQPGYAAMDTACRTPLPTDGGAAPALPAAFPVTVALSMKVF